MLSYQEILAGAERLTIAEKARLLAEISAELSESPQTTKHSLPGIWEGERLSSEDIDKARSDLMKE